MMFGPFKPSSTLLGGLLWKIPWRMSMGQKARQRQRLKQVDNVIKQLTLGLHVARCETKGIQYDDALKMRKKFKPGIKMLRLYNKSSFFPKEEQMSTKNKYTVFDRKERDYRKGIHKVPKWTKVSCPRLTKYH